MSDWIEWVIMFVKTHPEYAEAIVFVLAGAESLAFVSLVVPATVILVGISGLLGYAGVNFVPVIAAGSIGAMIGYTISYYVGWFFKDSIDGYWPFRTHPWMMQRGREFFAKWGTLGVFLGHFFGPVRAVIPVVAGVTHMSQWKFQAANVPSAILWSVGVMSPGVFYELLHRFFGS